MKQERLLTIQFARAVAATLVVLLHSGHMISLPQYKGQLGFRGVFDFGHSGVDFFFVLSGFIIFFVHHRDINNPSRFWRYAWRRCTRIFPSYWLVLSIALLPLVVKNSPLLTADQLLKSIFLQPGTDAILGPSWTLVFEMFFYVAFAAAIANIRLGLTIALVWLLMIASRLWVDYSNPYLVILSGYRGLEFLIGILVAFVLLKDVVPKPGWILGLGIAGFLLTAIAEDAKLIPWNSFGGNMAFSLSGGLIVLGAAASERIGIIKVGRIGEFLGGTSYLLYLVHVLVVGWTFHMVEVLGLMKVLSAEVLMLLALFLSFLTAGFLYYYFETRVLTRLASLGRQNLEHRKRAAEQTV